MGFSNNQTLGHDKPHCINCNYTFVNYSLGQSKLEDHFKSNHKKTILKLEEHIKSLNDDTLKAESLFGTSEPVLDKDKLAQFELSYISAKHLKAYSDGENIILPALIRTTEILFGNVKAQRVKKLNYKMTRFKEEQLKWQ